MAPIGILRIGTGIMFLFLATLAATLVLMNKQQSVVQMCLIGMGMCVLVLIATINGIWPRIVAGVREIGHWAGRGAQAAVPHVHGAAAAGRAELAGSPAFYLSLIFGAITLISFGVAYAEGEMGTWFHVGMIFAVFTAALIITHHEWWGDIGGWVRNHPAVVWLIVSVLMFAVSLSHVLWAKGNWTGMMVASIISAVLSAITALEWWPQAWRFLRDHGIYPLGRALFARGENSAGKALTLWAIAVFIVMVPGLMDEGPSQHEGLAYILSTLYVVLMIAGIGFLVIKRMMK